MIEYLGFAFENYMNYVANTCTSKYMFLENPVKFISNIKLHFRIDSLINWDFMLHWQNSRLYYREPIFYTVILSLKTCFTFKLSWNNFSGQFGHGLLKHIVTILSKQSGDDMLYNESWIQREASMSTNVNKTGTLRYG